MGTQCEGIHTLQHHPNVWDMTRNRVSAEKSLSQRFNLGAGTNGVRAWGYIYSIEQRCEFHLLKLLIIIVRSRTIWNSQIDSPVQEQK